MTFDEAQARYAQLTAAYQARQMDATQYSEAVHQLRVQNAAGRWWRISVSDGRWLCWDGAAWQAPPQPNVAQPPAAVPAPAPAAPVLPPVLPAQAPAAARVPALAAQPASPVLAVQAPAAQPQAAPAGSPEDQAKAFVDEAKRVPLRDRSPAWWDTLAVLGGLASGYIWFVYSSIRGMPRLNALTGGGESWVDFIPTVFLLALPVVLFFFRRAVMKKLQPLWIAIQRMPIPSKLGLSIVITTAAFMLPYILTFATNLTGLFSTSEGLDLLTPVIMLFIPLLLVWFRKETDAMLEPLQSFRQQIPKLVLVGVGLLIPFGVAFVLYALGFSMYPYMRLTVVFGTLLSYMVLRTPQLTAVSRLVAVANRGLPPMGPPALPPLGFWIVLGLGLLGCAEAAWADDFLRDPFNLNDGLRTNGAAQLLAGVATTTVTMLVNGAEVVRTIIQEPPGTSTRKPGEAAPHKNFQVVVDTVDQAGARSLDLDSAKSPTIYLYANCTAEGRPFPAGDPTISFTPNFDQKFVTLKDLGTMHGRRCAQVDLVLPPPDGEPPPTVSITVAAGADTLVSYPVTLSLKQGVELAAFVKGARVSEDPPVVIRYDTKQLLWVVPEVKICWCKAPGGTAPITVEFKYSFADPPFKADPDGVLEKLSFAEVSKDQYQLEFRAVPEQVDAFLKRDLEAKKGGGPGKDGKITVNVTATKEDQTKYVATWTFQIRPEVLLVAHGCDDNFHRVEHVHKKDTAFKFKELEFLADAQDLLPLSVFFVRTDVLGDDHLPPGLDPAEFRDKAFESAELTTVKLEGKASEEMTLGGDIGGDGSVPSRAAYKFTLTAKQPLLAASPRLDQPLDLVLDWSLKKDVPSNYSGVGGTHTEVKLEPRYLFMKLWVVPGVKIGTSDAAVYVCPARDINHPLANVPMSLRTEALGQGTLNVVSAEQQTTDQNGLAVWTLNYEGLTWDNWSECRFKVRAGPGDGTTVKEATEFAIDLGQNIRTFLEQLQDQRGTQALRLDNPRMALDKTKTGVWSFIQSAEDWCWPDYLTGPAWNIASCVGSADMGEYLCGSYSARIADWARNRRHAAKDADPEAKAGMNGIEIEQYKSWYLGPITHHYAGMYLAGTTSMSDPRFLDPWWRQDWSLPAYRTPDGLITKLGEGVRTTSSIALMAVMVVLAAKILVLLIPSLGIVGAAHAVKAFIAGCATGASESLTISVDEQQNTLAAGQYTDFPKEWQRAAAKRYVASGADASCVVPVRQW